MAYNSGIVTIREGFKQTALDLASTAAGPAPLFLSASDRLKNTYIWKLDESTDTLTPMALSYGAETAVASVFSNNLDILYTVEIIAGAGTFLRAWEWTADGQGDLITEFNIVGSTTAFSFITIDPSQTLGAGINQLAINTSSSVYVVRYDNGEFVLKSTIGMVHGASFRSADFSQQGDKLLFSEYSTNGIWYVPVNSSGVTGTRVNVGGQSQNSSFDPTGNYVIASNNGYNKVIRISDNTDTYAESIFGTGTAMAPFSSSTGIVALSTGPGWISNGTFTPFSDFPNLPGNDEFAISRSNNVNSGVRYIASIGYQSTNRLYKVTSNSLVDLGAIDSNVRQIDTLAFSR
jgi:hypothetical protein